MVESHIYATGMAAKLRSQWDRDEGLGQNNNAVKFLCQDYQSLRAQCLRSGKLFEDSLFPASPSSLGFNELGPRSSKTSGVRWMRPTEFCKRPEFIVDGASRTDICQGALASTNRMKADEVEFFFHSEDRSHRHHEETKERLRSAQQGFKLLMTQMLWKM